MGIILSLLAGFLSTSKDLVSKRLSVDLSGILSAFASFVYALPYYVVLLIILYLLGYEDFAFSKEFFVLIFLRALTDMGAEWSKMEAIERADISFISPFLGLAPLFLLVVSPLITGDTIPAYGIFAVLIIVAGSAILILKRNQTGGVLEKKAIGFALLTSLCFTFNNCFDRLAVQIASPTLSGFGMTIAAALFLLPFAVRKGNIASSFKTTSRPLWIRGFFELLYMVTKLSALQYLPVQYVSALSRSSLLFSVLGGQIIFKEGEFLRRLLGSALIGVGLVAIILLELY